MYYYTYFLSLFFYKLKNTLSGNNRHALKGYSGVEVKFHAFVALNSLRVKCGELYNVFSCLRENFPALL
jgi:hypothetical protein